MKVEVRYLLMFHRLTGKTKEIIELEQSNPTVRDLISKLGQIYGQQIVDALIDPKTGDVRYTPDLKENKKAVRILVNGRMTWWLNGLDTKLKEGDVVQLFG
ncbi:MAG: MoaD/ThiS family protein [Deltaproteobacteria bacterium]|nr:MoaD/ThiS family protein [Deltaproteobacteria bacterium]